MESSNCTVAFPACGTNAFFDGFQCYDCIRAPAWNLVITVCILVVFAVVILAFVWWKTHYASTSIQREEALPRIVLTFLQTNTLLAIYFSSDLNSVNLGLPNINANVFQCAIQLEYQTQLFVAMGSPILIGAGCSVVIGLLYLSRAIWKTRRHCRSRGRPSSASIANYAEPESMQQVGVKLSAAQQATSTGIANILFGRRHTHERLHRPPRVWLKSTVEEHILMWKQLFVLMLFSTHSTVSTTLLRIFDVVRVQGEDKVVRWDRAVSVYSDTYQWLWPLGLVGFLLIGLGMPAMVVAMLLRNKTRLQTKHFVQVWGFLYCGFKLDGRLYCWEGVVLLRKVSMTFCIVFFEAAFMRIYSATWVVAVALALQAAYQPYDMPQLNWCETISLGTTLVNLLALVLINHIEANPCFEFPIAYIHGSVAVVNIVVLVGFTLMLLALYMQRTRKYLDRHGCCWHVLRKLVDAVETGKQRRERYQGRLLRNNSQAARILHADRLRYMVKYGVDGPQPLQHELADVCFAMNPLQNIDSKLRPCSRQRRAVAAGAIGMHVEASVAAGQRPRSKSVFGDSGGSVNPLFLPQSSSREGRHLGLDDLEISQRLGKHEFVGHADPGSRALLAMPPQPVRCTKLRSKSMYMHAQPHQPCLSAESALPVQVSVRVRRRSSVVSGRTAPLATCSPNLGESTSSNDSDAGWSSDSSAESLKHKQPSIAQAFRDSAEKGQQSEITPKPKTKRLQRHSIHTSTLGSKGLSIMQLAQTYGPLGKGGMGQVTKLASVRQQSNRRLLSQASSRRLLVSTACNPAEPATSTSNATASLVSSSDMTAVRMQLRALAKHESASHTHPDPAERSTLPTDGSATNPFAPHQQPVMSSAALSIAAALIQPKSSSSRSKGYFAGRSTLVPSENELMFAFGKR